MLRRLLAALAVALFLPHPVFATAFSMGVDVASAVTDAATGGPTSGLAGALSTIISVGMALLVIGALVVWGRAALGVRREHWAANLEPDDWDEDISEIPF